MKIKREIDVPELTPVNMGNPEIRNRYTDAVIVPAGKYATMREAVEAEGANLTGANLTGADLRWAKLRGANLTGAKLDFASWPLHCGSLGVIVDDRWVAQMVYHVCAVNKSSLSDYGRAVMAALAPYANEFCKYRSDVKEVE